MQKNKCLRAKSLPPKVPVLLTLIAWLYVDFYKISGVWFGVICTVFALFWIIAILNFFLCEQLEPLWKETPKNNI